jgi:DNA-binding transcriptional ArsR family regulator
MKIKELAKIFKALGNERRVLILKHLLTKRELTVSQISELIRLSFKSVSKHLLILENANLVKSRQIGLNKLYSLNREGTREIINIIS